ncbi:MAG: hypothetical protein J6P97_05170 [Bacteroidales bacterium]|nr:hypothetical protein [Bacteroidales bacterium]
MADHVVDIDPLDPASIIRAEKMINKILKDVDNKVEKFVQEIGKIGRDAAQGAYGNAVSVTLVEEDNGVTISADGKAVAFLEFGAGSSTNSANRYAFEVPFLVYRGSYSDETKGEYQATHYNYWHFGGKKITAVEPRNGMQKAYEAIVNDIDSTVKKVFG